MTDIGSGTLSHALPYKPLVRPSANYEDKWRSREFGGAAKEQRAEERRRQMEHRKLMKEQTAMEEASNAKLAETMYDRSALLDYRPSSSSRQSEPPKPSDLQTMDVPVVPMVEEQPEDRLSAWVEAVEEEQIAKKYNAAEGKATQARRPEYSSQQDNSYSRMRHSRYEPSENTIVDRRRDYGPEAKAKREEERKKLAEERRRRQALASAPDSCGTASSKGEDGKQSRDRELPLDEQLTSAPSSLEHQDQRSGRDDAGDHKVFTANLAFEGHQWGADYLVMSVGDRVLLLREDEGWYLVRHVGQPTRGPLEGWCPPAYLEHGSLGE